MYRFINIFFIVTLLLLSACGTEEDPTSPNTTTTTTTTSTPAEPPVVEDTPPPVEDEPITPNDPLPPTQEINSSIISLCDTEKLTFDLLPTDGPLRLWLEGEEGVLDSTKLFWSPIEGADHYEFDITFSSGWEPDSISTQTNTNIEFFYDADTSGYRYLYGGDYFHLYSSMFNTNDPVSITVKAINTNGATIAQSESLSFAIAKAYIGTAPKWLIAESQDEAVALSWCSDPLATTYTIKYGTSQDQLDQTIEEISPETLERSISQLTNDSDYFFTLALANNNAQGKFGEILQARPAVEAPSIDLSIDRVTFNQSVQVDLDNNSNNTPIIANKKGVLRIFVNSTNPTQNQKVEVELGGSHNGVALPSIIKEVSLSNTPFSEADASNSAIYFDINASEWLQEGTSFYIKIDPQDKIAESDETNNRYPITDEKSFGFEDRYKMRIKLIPVLTSVGPVTITQEIVDGLSAYIQALYPLSEVEVTLGEEMDASSITPTDDANTWGDIIDELVIYKNGEVADDSTKADIFYYGVIDKYGDDPSGLAGLASINPLQDIQDGYEPRLIGVGRIDALTSDGFYETAAHEIGHNHGRYHVANSDETNDLCAIPSNTDSAYPYNVTGKIYGRIAKSGFSEIRHTLLDKNYYHDLMSYCSRTWISDYTYKAIYEYEKELDTFYSRASNPNALAPQRVESKTLGEMISGTISYSSDQQRHFNLKHRYSITWRSEIPSYETNLLATVIFEDDSVLEIPFFIRRVDHSSLEQFEFFIPSQKEIKSITISDTKSQEQFSLL